MLKSKIHQVTVTNVDLDYMASIKIDKSLMMTSDIREYEQVHIYNLNNGERFTTYAIEGPEGLGQICVNGAAARKVVKGDLLIIATYSEFSDNDLDKYTRIDAEGNYSQEAYKPKVSMLLADPSDTCLYPKYA